MKMTTAIRTKPSHLRTPRVSRDCTYQGSYVTGSMRPRWCTAVILVAAAAITALAIVGVHS